MNFNTRKFLPGLLSGLVFSCGLIASFYLTQFEQRKKEDSLELAFDSATTDIIENIKNRLSLYQVVMRGVQGLLLGSDNISYEQFRRYVESLQIREFLPGVQGIAFVSLINPDELTAHVAQQRQQVSPDYQIKPAGERDRYAPINFIAPLVDNETALGFDVLTNPAAREAMDRALLENTVIITSSITLVQDAGTINNFSFVMYLPVYKPALPIATLDQRKSAILGWVDVPFRMNDLMAGLEHEFNNNIYLEIHDGIPDNDSGMYRSLPVVNQDAPITKFLEKRTPLEIGGRQWTIVMKGTEAFEADVLPLDQSNLLLFASMALTSLLSLMVFRIAKARYSAETWLQGYFEQSADGILIFNKAYRFIDANSAATKMLGYPKDFLLRMGIQDTFTQHQRKSATASIDELKIGTSLLAHWEHKGSDNRKFPGEVSINRLDDNHYFTILRDLTEQKQAQQNLKDTEQALRDSDQRLQQIQKMEALGQLAGGVAHDFNNLLTVINGYSDILLESVPDDSELRDPLLEISHAGEKAQDLTKQLLAFSRLQVIKPCIVDINLQAQNFGKIIHRLIGEDIDVIFNLYAQSALVMFDPGQLDQILVNLAVNARDAMPSGGKLIIESTNVMLDKEFCSEQPDLSVGSYVLLSIADTGVGMDTTVKNRIFEPFFTTKSIGKGTGLGLATVHGIVKQSHGHISVNSELGHGTVFRIYLPVSNATTANNVVQQPVRALPGGTETILLVEDEENVRKLAEQILRNCGYTVFSAIDGLHAINLLDTWDGPLDLLLSDVVMPRQGGLEVAKHAATRLPACKVLFMSGYANDAIIRKGVMQAEFAFIQKPFTPSALAQKVRSVLDETQT